MIVDYSDEEKPNKTIHRQGSFPCFAYIDCKHGHISLGGNFLLNLHQIENFLEDVKAEMIYKEFNITFEQEKSMLKGVGKEYEVFKILGNKMTIFQMIKSLEKIIKTYDRNYKFYNNPIPHITTE